MARTQQTSKSPSVLSTPEVSHDAQSGASTATASEVSGGMSPTVAFQVGGAMGNSFLQGAVGGIQRKASGGDVDGETATRAMGEAASMSSGAPIDPNTRNNMESSFGQSFSDVRVHTDQAADSAASKLNAKAFTSGSDVYFGSGQYNPGSTEGKSLIAHELTHVAQGAAGAAKSTGEPSVSSPSDPAEKVADAAASAVVKGEPVGDVGGAPASSIHREDTPSGTPLEQLRAEADDWFVDEELCLRLINQLSPSEKTTARGDTALMQDLAGALDETEIVQAVNALEFPLKYKAYWIDQAGETSSVPAAQWQLLIMRSMNNLTELQEFMGWTELFNKVRAALNTTPIVLFSSLRASPTWGQLLSTSDPLWAWLLESTPMTEILIEIASPSIQDGTIPAVVTKMKANGAWARMTGELPRGAGLASNHRQALRRLAGILPQPDCGQLFEVRFNKPLTAAAGVSWSVDDIRPVWDQLDVLPDQDVSENTILTTFRAISGDAGFANGDGSIELGNGLRTSTFWGNGPTQSANNGTPNPARLGHTVRHEIGHQVHAALQGTVDSWLRSGVGFWYFSGGQAGAESLIADLGGFPSKFKDKSDREVDFTDADKTRIKSLIASHSGGSTWGPNNASPLPVAGSVAKDTTLPANTAMTQAERDVLLWDSLPNNVRQVFVTSDTGPWYINYNAHPSGPKGQYFWNHWYSKPYYFSGTALSAINATGDNYSSMSEAEFFANCYAEYFADPAGYTDHTKWGGTLNSTVKDFMKNNILERQPYTPPAASTGAAGAPNPAASEGGGTGTGA